MSENTIERASHRLCEALHADCINPQDMEIHLPYDAWWRLCCRIEQLHRGMMQYDGRDPRVMPIEFKYMGVTYKAKR